MILIANGRVFNLEVFISKGHKNGANVSFLVESKIYPKLKGQILQMRYQNIHEGSDFTAERKKNEIFNLSMFLSVKN